ncbi:SepM family pheromone-processing serine protease [Metabacillus sp. RGM 3146]|uniref:SepM family pheromone-processing serine protease n=1 Tax=Metabacillus sp. RGM 3146 TaxID=3401092 RepID=UPI003B9D3775
MNKKKKTLQAFLIGIILAMILSYIKLPFYILKPGSATPLEPIIKVDKGSASKGSFSLTTVSFGRASIVSYLLAKFNSYDEMIPVDRVKQPDESDNDYLERQVQMMKSSQDSAVVIAYKKAEKKVTETFDGVYVTFTEKNMPGSKVFKKDDKLVKVNEIKLTSAEQFQNYISSKKAGDRVNITYEREGEKLNSIMKLSPFKEEPERAGIGISLMNKRKVTVSPNVSLNTENIGGPSAGLMMSLEIYDQLKPEDLTKGYKIAGTGTISETGEIGPIGGIAQKIVAADKAGVKIFFAPNEHGKKESNYKQAKLTAEKIHSSIKLVPVDKFDDAVFYLEKLKNAS